MTRRRLICFFFFIVLSVGHAFALQNLRPVELDSTVRITSDSLTTITLPQKKSTTTAVLLSAVLPGAGQVYTERYWKIPIIWGFGIYLGSQWNKANNRYSDASDRYSTSLALVEGGDARARYERDFYRDERDRFAFYLALTYFLNLVDAYVGASLYEFDVSDDLGGNAQIRVSIPVR